MTHFNKTAYVISDDGSETYLHLLDEILRDGKPVTARGMPTRELRSVTVCLADAEKVNVLRTTRRPSLKIAATEAMHLLGGISSLEQLDQASGGRFTQFSDRGRLRGAYGPRAYLQLLMAERLLRKDPETRQAGVSIWDGKETAVSSRDVPCTTNFHFYQRDGYLELDVHMRSNDILLGFPIDIMMFSLIHRAMAWALGVPAGVYRHHAGSLHVYEGDLERCEEIRDAGLSESSPAISQVPLPSKYAVPDWNRGISYQATVARSICLREHEYPATIQPDGIEVPELAWLCKHVPFLGPGWGYCPLCRYAIRQGKGCTECSPVTASWSEEAPAQVSPEVLRPYIGRYVAIKDGCVIADAADITGVIQFLREKKIMANSVFRVPSEAQGVQVGNFNTQTNTFG